MHAAQSAPFAIARQAHLPHGLRVMKPFSLRLIRAKKAAKIAALVFMQLHLKQKNALQRRIAYLHVIASPVFGPF